MVPEDSGSDSVFGAHKTNHGHAPDTAADTGVDTGADTDQDADCQLSTDSGSSTPHQLQPDDQHHGDHRASHKHSLYVLPIGATPGSRPG